MIMVIAYLRVSTEKQVLENQRDEIIRFADKRGLTIDRWCMEKVSGTKSKDERKIKQVLSRLKKEDVLIISEISRLSRTMLDIMGILNTCIKKEIILYSVKEGYSFENNMNSKIMGFAFGMAAEIERNLIAARTREALAYRKSQGVILGRPKGSCSQKKKLEESFPDLLAMLAAGHSKTRIASHFNVSRSTLYDFLKDKDRPEN